MSELAGSSRLSPSLVRGVHEELILADMQLTVSRLPDRQLTDSSYVPKILRAHSADGILINYTHHVPDDLPKLLDKHNIPAVWINTRRGKHCVYADEEQAFDRATQHLIDLGHRRIAYYVSSLAGHFSETDRQTGYVRAMRRAGLTPQVHHAGAAEHADPIHDDRQRRAVNFLRNPNRPTAVLGYSTVDAVVLTVAAAACGLTLGRELSLVGLGDEEGSITGASMTQIVIQQDRIGAAAVRRLLRLIETPSEASPDRLLEADFFIGGSTGPPSPSR
ncbi:MAG: substrate-binding domain-containing protein [Planctomycetota bacterium]